jgi:hypothetical protein
MTTAWTPATFSHTGIAPGTCSTCHNGTTATGKPSNHIPTTAACDACHKTTTPWAPATMSHTAVVSATCDSCHGGAYTAAGAEAKPTNHIPTALVGGKTCNACHTSTTNWSSQKMDHNNIVTGCKTCHATGTNYLGDMEKKSVTHESSTATDCSQSGCHKPLGNKGVAYVEWD